MNELILASLRQAEEEQKEMPRRVNPKADSEKLNAFFRFALKTAC